MSQPRIVMVGSSMMDLIAYVPRLPTRAETIEGTEFRTGFGGKGSNQAVMAARLGARVAAVVRLGRDSFGDDTLGNYRDQGIDVEHVEIVDGYASGVAPIAVESSTGDNSIIVVPGANATLGAADVDRAAATIASADVVLCQLETPLDATRRAFEVAREARTVTTILNPAPAAEVPDDVLHLTDVFVPNEVEAAFYLETDVRSPDAALDAARSLQRRGPRSVVVTLGDRGAVFVDHEGHGAHVPTPTVRAVDSTGAGDAFVGALGTFLGTREPLEDACRKACAIAARSVTKHGTQTSFPYRAEVEDLISDGG